MIMKNMRVIVCVLFLMGILTVRQGNAQSLQDILNSKKTQEIVNAVQRLSVLKFEDLQGTWQYKGSACQFKSDDLLQKVGGVALAESLKKKLDNAYAKAGIVPGKFSYTFCKDSTFTSQLGKKTLKGTYSYEAATGQMTLKYYSLITSEAQVVRWEEGITLLFDAERLLKLVCLFSNFSKNATLSSIGKLAEQYDGLLLGFDLNK